MQSPIPSHNEYDNLPRAIVAMEARRSSGMSTGWHAHPRAQLLYATEGVMVVHTDAGSWVVPPNRALWMVAGLRHNVIMSGDVLMRTAYIDARQFPGLPTDSGVINVSPLLRELLVEAVKVSPTGAVSGRNALLLDLLVCEFQLSSAVPLHLPMPEEIRVRRICQALIKRPADASSAADWAQSEGMGERTLHRLFQQGTGMTFSRWREQARLLHAMTRMAEGHKLIDVAMDSGYASPSAFAAMFRRHFGVTPSSFYR